MASPERASVPRRAVSILIVVGFLAAVTVVWAVMLSVADRMVSPSQAQHRLRVFFEERNHRMARLSMFHLGEDHYVLVVEKMANLCLLPSGPPCFVFDEDGDLVDWVHDSGDAPSFHQRWGSFEGERELDLDASWRLVEAATNDESAVLHLMTNVERATSD